VPHQPALLATYGLRISDLIEMPYDERSALLEDLVTRERTAAMEVQT